MKYDTAANFCLIALGSYDVKCKSPTKPSIGVTIPGKIFNWMKSMKSKAIEECLDRSSK